MNRGLAAGACSDDDASRDGKHPRECRPVPAPPDRSIPMQWTTPSATDFRFGFEITMYVAAR
jgi:coenzyme PQQ precursor peptide PqqA